MPFERSRHEVFGGSAEEEPSADQETAQDAAEERGSDDDAETAAWVAEAETRRETEPGPTDEDIDELATMYVDAYEKMAADDGPTHMYWYDGAGKDLLDFSRGEKVGESVTPSAISSDFANYLPEDFGKLIESILDHGSTELRRDYKAAMRAEGDEQEPKEEDIWENY